MCSIYVINVGANTNHSSQACSPIFDDGSFVFVSFCAGKEEPHRGAYPPEMLPFTNPDRDDLETHNDPDWCNMTYGDICSGKGCARGSALRHVVPGDILLFWGLLYHNECLDWKSCNDKKGACWKKFSRPLDTNKGWYLLGAMRVGKIVKDNQEIEELCPDLRCRVKNNAHVRNDTMLPNHRVFLGDKQHSRLFDKAVALWVPKSNSQNEWESSLMYKNFRAAKGQCLSLNDSPRWSSSLRTCRKIWDLSRREECVHKAIRADNPDFDLLKDARC